MKTCYVNVQPEGVKKVLQKISDSHPNDVFLITPIGKVNTQTPSKKKPTFRINLEAIIPEDTLLDKQNCLCAFGAVVILNVPRSLINPEYLTEAGEVHD